MIKKQTCKAGETEFVEVDDEYYADDAKEGQPKWSIPLPSGAAGAEEKGAKVEGERKEEQKAGEGQQKGEGQGEKKGAEEGTAVTVEANAK